MKNACLAVLVSVLLMAACGGQDGIEITSSYRTNQEQMKLCQPGHSLHETARAFDIDIVHSDPGDIVEFELNGKRVRAHKAHVAPLLRADAAMKRAGLKGVIVHL